MFDTEKLAGAFIGGHNFGFTGALGGLVLMNCVPSDRTTAVKDKEARERSILKEFKRGTVEDGVAGLAAPVCITESINSLTGMDAYMRPFFDELH